MRNNLIVSGCLLFVIQNSVLAQTATAVIIPDPPAERIIAGPSFTPMTPRDRLHHYFNSTFNVGEVVASAASAGITQWEETPREWGQGAEGYGKRFASAYGKNIVRQTIMFGLSSALHEDNRYIRSGQSGVKARLKYAIVSTFLARRDDGTRRLSYSRLGGTAGAAFISRSWQPPSEDNMGDAAMSFGVSMGTQVAFNVVREFVHRPK